MLNASLVAFPPTSVSVPKLVELFVTPLIDEVPVLVILPEANGEPAVGLTRTFCQVRLQVTPLVEAAVTVKVI